MEKFINQGKLLVVSFCQKRKGPTSKTRWANIPVLKGAAGEQPGGPKQEHHATKPTSSPQPCVDSCCSLLPPRLRMCPCLSLALHGYPIWCLRGFSVLLYLYWQSFPPLMWKSMNYITKNIHSIRSWTKSWKTGQRKEKLKAHYGFLNCVLCIRVSACMCIRAPYMCVVTYGSEEGIRSSAAELWMVVTVTRGWEQTWVP